MAGTIGLPQVVRRSLGRKGVGNAHCGTADRCGEDRVCSSVQQFDTRYFAASSMSTPTATTITEYSHPRRFIQREVNDVVLSSEN